MSPPNPPVPSVVQAISAQFASRPTFEAVTRSVLAAAIKEKYPSLALDLSKTQLAMPLSEAGKWKFVPFISTVLDYLARGTPLDISEVNSLAPYLSDTPPTRLRPASGTLDMSVIKALVEELPWCVPIGLQNALTDYWNEVTDNQLSRWLWLSATLKDTLSIAVMQHRGLTDLERETISQVVIFPGYDERRSRHPEDAVYAYTLQATLPNGDPDTLLLSGEILLVRKVNAHDVILLCSPGGAITSFPSMDAFIQDWGLRMAAPYATDKVTCQRYEVQGELFDNQAVNILNLQLHNLERLRLPGTMGLAALQTLYRELSDPAYFFTDLPHAAPAHAQLLRQQLPPWLHNASAADRMLYRHYSLEVASSKMLNKGRTFLSEITDIHTFTVNALNTALLLEQKRQQPDIGDASPTAAFAPDKVMLTFTHYAGYPGAVGVSDKTHISLTQLAIKNLVGSPSGTLTLTHADGLTLPTWLTADFILRDGGLIEQVDIGKHYPDYLETLLLSGTPEVRERERLFAIQASRQLALLALELHLKNECAITAVGARYVAALVQPDADDRYVDGRAVVIRCLALLRKPEARPDIVANMFIIEAQDNTTGPHLLYRPLYSEPLREFSSREALLQAIAEPGALQTSVLTWLTDAARPIYANGGFQSPHYVRFGQGDEFSPPEIPAPARLSDDGASDELLQYLLNGRLMEYLYGSNARAMIDQASQESVSNQTSRWALLLEGGGLIFSTLLQPLLRGPAMLTAWLLALTASASRDIPALNSSDPVARELATADLLLNLVMVLFEAVPAVTAKPTLAQSLKDRGLRAPARRRVPEQWPQPKPPLITEGIVGITGRLPGNRSVELNLGFSSARNRLTVKQRENLLRLRVPRPNPLPQPVLNGPRRGLYAVLGDWCVLIEGDLYRVRLEHDGGVIIVDPLDTSRTGPKVKPNDAGRWSLDLNLRLLGGMPPTRIAAIRQRKAQRKVQLQDQLRDYLAQQVAVQQTVDIFQAVMEKSQADSRFTPQQRANQRRQFDQALERQTLLIQQLLEAVDEYAEHNIPLSPNRIATLTENAINNARKSVSTAEMDRSALYTANTRFTQNLERLPVEIAAHYDEYLGFLKQVDEINQRVIRWLEFKDRQLEALYGLSPEGVKAFERLTEDREGEISSLGVKSLQLITLRSLSVKELDFSLMDGISAIINPLKAQVRSHAELNNLELSPAERRETLESLVDHYGKAVDGLQGINIVNGDELERPYFEKLCTLVESLYEEASQQLANEFKPDPVPRKRPPKRPKKLTGHPEKRVIRTRKSGVLIGEVQPAGTSLPIESVQVRDEYGNQTSTQYTLHDDLWDEVKYPSAPVPKKPARPINVIKGEARALFQQLDAHLSRADRYKKLCRHPQEIEELLSNEGARLNKIATELDLAIQDQPAASRSPADQTLVDGMRQGVQRLNDRGLALRIALSLELPPTHANLQFLFEQRKIQVASLGERIALTGERRDFIQEYAINDRKGYPLWYAHFHYATAQTPKADYSIAHLKTVAQRRESYYSLLDKAQGAQAVVDVHRGMLGKTLTERKFLPLVN